MREEELIDMLASRTGTSRPQAAAMLDALADLVREARQRGDFLPLSRFGAFCSEACRDWAAKLASPESPVTPPPSAPFDRQPEECEVDALLETARSHPLGMDFLLRGELGAVAAVFRTHAFTVEAARRRSRERTSRASSANDASQE